MRTIAQALAQTPAHFWRAFFVCALLVPAAFAAAPPVAPPGLSQAGKPDPEEAARLLEEFRRSGIPGEYYLEFELHALPRRGEESIYQGRLWGSRNEQGALTRIELIDGQGRKHRLLLQNGERPSVHRFTNARVTKLDTSQLFEPLIPGVDITAFDVQMPFLYWPDATLEKVTRALGGRPAHAFFFRAPPDFVARYPDVVAARAYLDAKYNALLETELIGRNGSVVKSFRLLSLKTIDQQTLPKTADYRNELTRDKTRLLVTGAALRLDLPPEVFEPDTLGRDAPVPAPVVRID